MRFDATTGRVERPSGGRLAPGERQHAAPGAARRALFVGGVLDRAVLGRSGPPCDPERDLEGAALSAGVAVKLVLSGVYCPIKSNLEHAMNDAKDVRNPV